MRQRTDSTHVLGRIRDLNRLELAGESVRAALEALAAAAPGWLAGVIDASWQEVYGQRIDDFRLPDSTAGRADLAVRYGRDGYHLLRQVHDPGAPGWLAGLPAVQALRRIWIQQFCLDVSAGGEKVIWLLSGAEVADIWCDSRHAVCRRILVCAVVGGRVRWRRRRADEGIRRPSRYLSGRGVPGGPCRARRRCAHGKGRCCLGRGPACQG